MKLLTFVAAILLPVTLTGQSNSFTNSTTLFSSPFDLVITEIMPDPEPSFGLPEAEYVEILNRSDDSINLTGWTLFDGSNRILPDYDLPPGQFLIICANSDTSEFIQFGNVAGISSLSLTNSGEKIAIRNPQGLSIDSVTYSDSWLGSSFKKDGGWSLERIDPEFTCLVAENWKVSIDNSGGTPGGVNSVNDIYTDGAAPVLLRAYCPDSVSVILVFSEPIDLTSALNIQHYYTNSSLLITSSTFADATNSKIKLEFSQVIHPGQTGYIFANEITDCAGNKIEDRPVKFGLVDSGKTPSIVINEILFNPFESGYDFIELYNSGNFIVSSDKLMIASRNLSTGEIENAAFIFDEPWLIFPGDYIVLTEKPIAVSSFYRTPFPFGFIEVDDMPSMNVDAGQIAILFNGEVIDEVYYEESFHFSLIEDPKGVSLEKINPIRNGMDPDSWHSASTTSGYATPGNKNSQFSTDAADTKSVFVHPEIFSPDQDGKDDVISFEISAGEPGYISKISIYNSSGYMIFENKGNQILGVNDSYSWDGITNNGEIAQPGIYVALVEILNLQGDVEHVKLPLVVAIKL